VVILTDGFIEWRVDAWMVGGSLDGWKVDGRNVGWK
jgi:hypothetical protein